MTPENLAIVFAPNVLRPEVEDSTTMMDSDSKNRIISLLITRATEVFSHDEEVLSKAISPRKHGKSMGIPPPKRPPIHSGSSDLVSDV